MNNWNELLNIMVEHVGLDALFSHIHIGSNHRAVASKKQDKAFALSRFKPKIKNTILLGEKITPVEQDWFFWRNTLRKMLKIAFQSF